MTVQTERERYALEGEAWLAREAVAGLLDERLEGWPDRSEPAVAVWLNSREREHGRVRATAALGAGELMLDGSPARFTIASAAGIGWAAVRRHEDLVITVTARDAAPEEIELEPLVA